MAQRARIQLKPRPEAEGITVTSEAATTGEQRTDRKDKRIIAGHFAKATWAQLRALCIQQDKTSQQLLEEALTDLFQKYRTR
jgi:hypothetical protein